MDNVGAIFSKERRCYLDLQRYANRSMLTETFIHILKKKYSSHIILDAIRYWMKNKEKNTTGREYSERTEKELEEILRNPHLIDRFA